MNAWDLQSRHHLQTRSHAWAQERSAGAGVVARAELDAIIGESGFQSRIVSMAGQAAAGLASAGSETRSLAAKLRSRWPAFLSAE